MTSCHSGHSELRTTTATGPPSVRPKRTPPRISSSSASSAMRRPRPWPRRRRANSADRPRRSHPKPGGQALHDRHQARRRGIPRQSGSAARARWYPRRAGHYLMIDCPTARVNTLSRYMKTPLLVARLITLKSVAKVSPTPTV